MSVLCFSFVVYSTKTQRFTYFLLDISKPTATLEWVSNVSIPSGMGFYLSLNTYKDSFLSLAPDSWEDLSIVQVLNPLITPNPSYKSNFLTSSLQCMPISVEPQGNLQDSRCSNRCLQYAIFRAVSGICKLPTNDLHCRCRLQLDRG